MKKIFTLENLYALLILCFVVSLCIFHGKVFGIGFIRNSPSDFLTKQFFLADIILVALIVVFAVYKRTFQTLNLYILLLLLTTWFVIPRGTSYSYYSVIRLL